MRFFIKCKVFDRIGTNMRILIGFRFPMSLTKMARSRRAAAVIDNFWMLLKSCRLSLKQHNRVFLRQARKILIFFKIGKTLAANFETTATSASAKNLLRSMLPCKTAISGNQFGSSDQLTYVDVHT